MRDENGFVLLLVLVIVCVMTYVVISLTTRTTQASFLAAKRANDIRAFPLAENAALEGYWQITNTPSYRGSQERYWSEGWYRFTIIDPTPLITDDDLSLEVLGEGFIGNRKRRIRLRLTRPNLNGVFSISSWREDNEDI